MFAVLEAKIVSVLTNKVNPYAAKGQFLLAHKRCLSHAGTVAMTFLRIFADHQEIKVVTQTGDRMITAISSPIGIGFINTHRKPDMNAGTRRVYWNTLRCTISRLYHGGTDKYGVKVDPAKALIIVGDFNASIVDNSSADDQSLKTLIEEFGSSVVLTENTYFCDHSNTVARYDYILYTSNLNFCRKLEDLDTIISDHKAIFTELKVTSHPVANVPHEKYKDQNWASFKKIVGTSKTLIRVQA
uniref:Endonuclease/exonuclease/phosphatase domain-containing protein n=1 Tax=Tetranychus urticae TaxID=32264 RepID=T1K0D9_TETUR